MPHFLLCYYYYSECHFLYIDNFSCTGRNTNVANTLINTILITALPQFTSKFSSTYISAALNSSQITSCINNGHSSYLSNLIYFSDINLTPTKIAPIGATVLNIGNIYVSVFGSVVFVNAVYKGNHVLVVYLTVYPK